VAKKREIILGVTGSIAAYKSCDLIRRLQEAGFNISVVMTREAEEFITPLTLETLSGNRVYRKMFEQARENWEIDHISLAEKADLVLVAPATANIIGKIAFGICDDILSCAVISTAAPVVVCPAMNDAMYNNKIVQENIKKLQGLGYKFIGPVKGRLACGKTGTGCLAPVEEIVEAVKKILK
jgi:phosphopantothenoylcysteine decarboxylase/phosphopantothenate--cysteine ligase